MLSALPIAAIRICGHAFHAAQYSLGIHRGQSFQRRHVIALALLLALTLGVGWALVGAVPVRAAGSVRYEQRDYAVQILPNCDVAVVEHWKVHFTGGPFHHAFLQIYLARTAGIDFGTVAGASAGTQQVSDRTDSQGNPVRRMEWDFPSTQDASRSFDIPYTLHGALGIGTSQAWLDWHFLDPGSQESFVVDESTVVVTLPTATKASDLSVKATDPDTQPAIKTVNATSVQASVQHVTANNPFEVMVAFPLEEVHGIGQRQPWQATDTPPTPPTSLGTQMDYPKPIDQPASHPDSFGSWFWIGWGAICPFFLIPVFFIIVILAKASGGSGSGYRGVRRPGGALWGPWLGGRGPWGGGGGFGGGGGGMGGGGGGGGGGSGFG